jgi:hypothetical protein
MGGQQGSEGVESVRGEADRGRTMSVPWVESPLFERALLERESRLTVEQRVMAVRFHTQGYLAVPAVVPTDLCDRVRQQIEPMFDHEEAQKRRRVKDAWQRGADAVRDLAVFGPIQELLRVFYERRPVPFQTLDFKWGTEQRGHSDSIHFSCIPARYMCGVWVALEDVDATNGPLFYYPGSHRRPETTGYDLGYTVDDYFYPDYEEFQHELMDELGIDPYEFHAAKGDALIWSSNVVHGGRPITRPGSTRWSQVSHYFFEGCIYYQPHASEIPTGELALLDVTDLNTMEPVPPTYNGKPVFVRPGRNGRSRLSFRDPARSPPPSRHRGRALGLGQRLRGR